MRWFVILSLVLSLVAPHLGAAESHDEAHKAPSSLQDQSSHRSLTPDSDEEDHGAIDCASNSESHCMSAIDLRGETLEEDLLAGSADLNFRNQGFSRGSSLGFDPPPPRV